jgi:hypothetical protein
MMPRFYVLGLGDPLCRNGFGMMENFVTNLIVVQTIDKLFWYFHGDSVQTITFPTHLYFPSSEHRRKDDGARTVYVARCEVCENEYDKAFSNRCRWPPLTADAIHALAPICYAATAGSSGMAWNGRNFLRPLRARYGGRS